MAYLAITQDQRRYRYPLSERETVIGRGEEADLVLDDEAVSRRQASIAETEEGWVLENLSGKNPTLLNGVAVEGAEFLKDGDSISVAGFVLVFRVAGQAVVDGTRTFAPAQRGVVKIVEPETGKEAAVRWATLTVVEGDERDVGRHWDITQAVTRVGNCKSDGRREEWKFRLNDESVSFDHLTIEAGLSGFRLLDLDSTNGTFVDGKRIRDMVVEPGVMIRLASTTLRLDPYLEREEPVEPFSEEMIGNGTAMREAFELMRKVAPSELPVIILGESGTGKELAARAIHFRSKRAGRPYVTFNMASIPKELIENELFGNEKGAFTGAVGRRGLFEQAKGGTLFMDEIGDLPLAQQAPLLRVLQEGVIRRVGGTADIPVDVRLIFATNRNLEQMVARGTFRNDLYFRIWVLPVRLPPLRDRTEDILPIAQHVLAGRASTGAPLLLTQAARERLMAYPWPGNVRELNNVLVRAAVMVGGGEITAAHLEFTKLGQAKVVKPKKPIDVKRRAEVEEVLARHKGNKTKAAEEMGINRPTFYLLLERLGIPREWAGPE